MYMRGGFPDQYVDHKNRIKNDNRWDNLREASNSQNGQNIINAPKNNILGILGVTVIKRKHGSVFKSRIVVDGKRLDLGLFNSAEEARTAYLDTKHKCHSHCPSVV